MTNTIASHWKFLRQISVSLMIGSLAGTVLLESLDPRSSVGDFIFWPQHYFHYFLKFGANSPVAPRIMFAAIVAVLSVIALFATRISAVEARIATGMAPPMLALMLPMIIWTVSRRGYVGIEASFALVITFGYMAALLYFAQRRLRISRWGWLGLWVVWLCWWGYLFRTALDPITLIAPVSGFLAGAVWSLSDRRLLLPGT